MCSSDLTRIGPEVAPKCYAGTYMENIEALSARGVSPLLYSNMLGELCSLYGLVEALEKLYLTSRDTLHGYSRLGAWLCPLPYLLVRRKMIFHGNEKVVTHKEVRENPEMYEVIEGCGEGDCGNHTMSSFLTDVIRVHRVKLGLLSNYNEVSAGNFVEALLHIWKGFPGYEPLCLVLLAKDHLMSGVALLIPDDLNPLLQTKVKRQIGMPGRIMSVAMVKVVFAAENSERYTLWSRYAYSEPQHVRALLLRRGVQTKGVGLANP